MSRLPSLPALRDFIHMYRLQAKKILSQNYLMDMNITRKIVRNARVEPNDYVVEIGPGPGGITRAILEAGVSRLDVVEIDDRFIPPLEHVAEASNSRMFIHQADALKTDISEFYTPSATLWHDECPPIHVIGNLPFNIASPLIIKYLRDMSYRRSIWKYGRVPLTLTFQLEVAKRICSPIASDARSSFVPRPLVDVGVVRFEPRKTPLINVPFEVVEKVCRHVFHYRQKHVNKGLKTLYPKELANELTDELLRKTRIDPTTTSIRLGIEQFSDLSDAYFEQCRRIAGLFAYDYTKPHRKLEMLDDSQLPLPLDFEKINDAKNSWRLREFTVS
ncbi:unnamed protein product [Caenorhabditis bovis]|uniref:rRNA adenine N(6)-methyltransferase n=1 Tax=Caenorhabditis bovis TaxID=2654633 RepID=A0A8S1F3D3_9PELO|nr:unnamed protein product [Caenorhabditis bovis]